MCIMAYLFMINASHFYLNQSPCIFIFLKIIENRYEISYLRNFYYIFHKKNLFLSHSFHEHT